MAMRWGGPRRRRRGGVPALIVVVLLLLWQQSQRCSTAPEGGTEPARAPVAAAVGRSANDQLTLESGERPLSGPVVKVVDGDTLHVELVGSITPREKVRLLNINTPERDAPGYERATAALVALVTGREVQLIFEQPDVAKRDEYGRLLAYVLLDGRCVNLAMVRAGYSRFFDKYGPGRFPDAFRAAESAARAGNEGLWSDGEWNGAVAVERSR